MTGSESFSSERRIDMRHALQRAVLIAVTAFCPPAFLYACLWDTETLLQERAAAPSVLEVIVGKFPRHSKAYYMWRLEDRQKKLESDPNNLRLLDDIAVSHEKLGDHDAAIAIAREQLSQDPRRYETLANLGTFLIHRGDLEEGMDYIAKAIEVNPDAHFGREKYQLLLVKYLLSQSEDGECTLPLGANRLSDTDWRAQYPFMDFLGAELLGNDEHWIGEQERTEAIEGILGMMRFAQHDHPVLLDVLGELLSVDDRRRLAFRCFMSAAANAPDADSRSGYETLARRVISGQYQTGNTEEPVPPEEVMAQFQKEKADADEWFAELVRNEAKWIEAGEDVDALFNEHYRQPPVALMSDDEYTELSSGVADYSEIVGWVVASLICALGIVSTLFVRIVRRRRSAIV